MSNIKCNDCGGVYERIATLSPGLGEMIKMSVDEFKETLTPDTDLSKLSVFCPACEGGNLVLDYVDEDTSQDSV